jgi:hypothetical protein
VGYLESNSANAAGFVPDGSAETGMWGSLGIDYWLGPLAMGRLVAWIGDLGLGELTRRFVRREVLRPDPGSRRSDDRFGEDRWDCPG